MVGASLGFSGTTAIRPSSLWATWDRWPWAGAIGTVAVIIKHEILLVAIAGVFVLEALSVMIQVFSFRFWRRRVFRMAPMHHHFELLGWTESKVVVRFWIAALIFALFS